MSKHDDNEPSADFVPPDMTEIFKQNKLPNVNPFNTEPDSAMRQLAQSNWSCYCAHVQVGFNPNQAMHVVLTIVSASIMSQQGEDNG